MDVDESQPLKKSIVLTLFGMGALGFEKVF